MVGDAKRQVENKRAEEVVSSGNVEADLRKALEVRFLLAVYHICPGFNSSRNVIRPTFL